MMSNDAELNCEHALDEIRSEIQELSESAMRARVFVKIDDLEASIEKLFSQEIKARKKDE